MYVGTNYINPLGPSCHDYRSSIEGFKASPCIAKLLWAECDDIAAKAVLSLNDSGTAYECIIVHNAVCHVINMHR